MKRTYKSPTILVVEINSQKLFAISTVNVSSQDYDDGTMTDLVRQESNVGSSSWDDEW
jgi:hypothetical protein